MYQKKDGSFMSEHQKFSSYLYKAECVSFWQPAFFCKTCLFTRNMELWKMILK